MPSFRCSTIVLASCLLLLFLNLPFSAGQEVPVAPNPESEAESDKIDPYNISVSVSEVRFDVVVLDNKGRHITDLTPDDFEVYQDGRPQNVTSSIYITNQTEATASNAASQISSKNLPPISIPGTTLKEEVRRTIVFVVDNLSMRFSDLSWAKMSMKRFLERQMQPGDMVAIIHTSYGNSAIQTFLSDKRLITGRIDRIPFMGPTEEDEARCIASRNAEDCPMPDGNMYHMYDNQLSTLSYSIRALNDMPGRKILIFLSGYPTLKNPAPVIFDKIPVNFYQLYGTKFERLANDAQRANVVVHLMDVRGLDERPEKQRDQEKRGALNPLPAKTGGTFIQDTNFFLNGIGEEVNNMITGYYLVSYTPPTDTFKTDRKDGFRRVQINVKRKGAKVYTRDGFYVRTENEMDSAASPAQPLQNAIWSPFLYADLNVNIAAGYLRDANAGHTIRSWIHIDPKDVTVVETEDGGARIDIETVCMISDINGFIYDFRDAHYIFNLEAEKKAENIAWIQKHGIRFVMLLPVQKPGSYTVRIAVHDTLSGKIGSAYQSVVIPDLKKNGLKLSNIFMITSADDLVWMRSDASQEIAEGTFFPVFQNEEVPTPALRTYAPGNSLQTLTILYNADAESIYGSKIEIQTILYKDGMELMRGQPRPIVLGSGDNIDSIPILQRFTLGSDIKPGDYILQLLVTDKKNSKKKEYIVSETLYFKVVESP